MNLDTAWTTSPGTDVCTARTMHDEAAADRCVLMHQWVAMRLAAGLEDE